MQDNENEIRAFLSARRKPPAVSPDLAERIIHDAVSGLASRASKPAEEAGWWNDLMAMFVLPHPSVIVAAGVLLGLLVGVETGEGLTFLQQDWSSFMDINEGGWL